jgi:alpha-beta hydrolase superfamily lysophospholipase
MERVQLTTEDGKNIVGHYYAALGDCAVLLLHMLKSTKESWQPFAEQLHEKKCAVLSIDFRGHGESEGGPEGYKQFSDEDHQKFIMDIDAAVKYLARREFSKVRIAGASIGANLALLYASEHVDVVEKILLLSAGLDYKGIKSEPLVVNLKQDQEVYFVGDERDVKQYGSAAANARKLHDLTKSKKYIKIFTDAKHGTDMLNVNQKFEEEMVQWLGTSS